MSEWPQYALYNNELDAWIIGPGTGVDETHETPEQAAQARDEITDDYDDHLTIVEITPVD